MNNSIKEYITLTTGLEQSIWKTNEDLDYLFTCALNFNINRLNYSLEIFHIIEPRIKEQSELYELRNILVEIAEQSNRINSPDNDIFAAQAVEIIANDYWLLGKIQKSGAPLTAIKIIKDGIINDALDVGRRLFNNAIKKLTVKFKPNEILDINKIKPLGKLFNEPEESYSSDLNEVSRVHLIINAGRSTRLRTTIPKGILYLNDKPIIQYTIEAGKNADIEKTYVVLGFKKELNEYFISPEHNILFQKTQDGTAHAVMCAYSALKDFKGTLLVSYSDMPLITSKTLERLLETHENSNALMTILTTPSEKRPEFGKLIKDNDGHFLRIAQDRIEEAYSDQADAGFYCFNCPDFWQYLKKVTNNNNRYEYYLTDIMREISLCSIPINGYETKNEIETIGINRPDELIRADYYFKEKHIKEQIMKNYSLKDESLLTALSKLIFYHDYGAPDLSKLLEGHNSIEEIKGYCIELASIYDNHLNQFQGAIFNHN